MTAAILTISDSASQGTRDDLSGPAVAAILLENGYNLISTDIVPDDRGRIAATLIQMCEVALFVVTTGGTGLSPRDLTPEATASVCDKQVPGVAELMRTEGLKQTPLASLSRGICGSRGKSLILNLPGSPKGATSSLTAVMHLIPHALDLLSGKTDH
jgi:molybdenum cofactor synthesis domain-containing protein